jgi:hypothetical protein
VAERSKARAWKARVRSKTVPWVRIPPSPPHLEHGTLRFLIVIALCAIALPPAAAQEISFLGGATRNEDPPAGTYAWQLWFSRDLSEHWAASFTWRNDGHVPSHHRDGHSMQLWAKTTLFSPRLAFAAGAGPYRYFDTVAADGGAGYGNDHGWGVLYSLSATWRTQGRLLYQARLDRVEARHSIDVTSLAFGVGYKLDQDGELVTRGSASLRDEVTLFAGRTIVNSLESEGAVATGVEYRHAFNGVLRGTVAWMNEGDSRLVGRNGIVTQAWLEPGFSGDRFTLGIGFGVYFAEDRRREGDDSAVASGILTMTASYRFGRDWTGRLSWNRVVSSYDRDTDVIVFGVGYRFGH